MSSNKRRALQVLQNLAFNDYGLSHRYMDTGVVPNTMAAVPAAQVLVGKHMPVRIANNSGAIIYVAIGIAGMAAPTGMTDGMAIFSGTAVVINTGDKDYIRFDGASANAQYVIMKDDGKSEE